MLLDEVLEPHAALRETLHEYTSLRRSISGPEANADDFWRWRRAVAPERELHVAPLARRKRGRCAPDE
jgi:hypothetical protein